MAGSLQSMNFEEVVIEMSKKIAILEERTNHQFQNLQQIQKTLEELSREINRRIPISVMIYFSVAAMVIGVLSTLVSLR